jgi:hypothetical protein
MAAQCWPRLPTAGQPRHTTAQTSTTQHTAHQFALENALISVESTVPLASHMLRLNAAPRPVGPTYVVAHFSGPRHCDATPVLTSTNHPYLIGVHASVP